MNDGCIVGILFCFVIRFTYVLYHVFVIPLSHLVFISFVKVEKTVADVGDDISQGSEGISDSNCQSSTPGLDSDHDYTVIGSGSPTHTEDRW